LRYSFSERDHTKSVTLVDLEPNGAVSVHAIRLEQPRAMAEICGTVDEVVSDAKHDSLAQAWLRITVTDRTRPDQMFTRVKSRFPHVLQVFHLPAGAAPAGVLTSREAREQDPRELGADFIFHVTGHRAVEAEVDLFEQAYQAAAQVASA
jgi:exonuclease SbcD